MEFTARGLWTMIHGMGFGALYLLACSGALVELIRRYSPDNIEVTRRDAEFLRVYLIAMAALAWLIVLTGTYVIYPWYRAIPPAGVSGLAGYPQRLLLSSAATAGWHGLGMEWKEHVAWIVPMATTMAAAVTSRYGGSLKSQPQIRGAVLCFLLAAFLAGGVAGFLGAMLNKHAPVEGGGAIRLSGGQQ